MKFLRHLLGITKLDKEKNQCIRGGKMGAQNIVKGKNSARKSGYNTSRGWAHIEYQNKHDIDQKDEEHRMTKEEMEGPTPF